MPVKKDSIPKDTQNKRCGFKIGFAGKEEIDDFILTPCLSYSWCDANNTRADAIGIKFGYWAVYIAYIRVCHGKE